MTAVPEAGRAAEATPPVASRAPPRPTTTKTTSSAHHSGRVRARAFDTIGSLRLHALQHDDRKVIERLNRTDVLVHSCGHLLQDALRGQRGRLPYDLQHAPKAELAQRRVHG